MYFEDINLLDEAIFYMPFNADTDTQDGEFPTTFWNDFGIAEVFGEEAINDTFNRSFDAFKDSCKYLTALSMTLNHKCWEQYEKGYHTTSQLYASLYHKVDNYALDNLKGDELEYYLQITD